jgi:ribosomal protein S20
MSKARWIGLGLGAFLVLAMLGVLAWSGLSVLNTAGSVIAQGNPTPTPAKGGVIGDTFWNLLAQKLGLNADTLKSKAIETRKDMLDTAVKDGLLTQDQADKLKERLNSNNLIAPIPLPRGKPGAPFTGPKGAPNGKPGVPFFGHGVEGLNTLEAVAKVLNLSTTDLLTQLKGGKTLADVAKAQNVDEAKVKQAIIDTESAQIDRAVTDGVITKEQGDKLKANLTPDKIDLSHPGFGFYHRFGH